MFYNFSYFFLLIIIYYIKKTKFITIYTCKVYIIQCYKHKVLLNKNNNNKIFKNKLYILFYKILI